MVCLREELTLKNIDGVKLLIQNENMLAVEFLDGLGMIHPKRIDEYIEYANSTEKRGIAEFLTELKNKNVTTKKSKKTNKISE